MAILWVILGIFAGFSKRGDSQFQQFWSNTKWNYTYILRILSTFCSITRNTIFKIKNFDIKVFPGERAPGPSRNLRIQHSFVDPPGTKLYHMMSYPSALFTA